MFPQGKEVELTFELLSDKIAPTSRATTEDKRPVKGADGQLASLTLKFKPFTFEIGEDQGTSHRCVMFSSLAMLKPCTIIPMISVSVCTTGAQFVRRGVVRQGIKGWVSAAHKAVNTAPHGSHGTTRRT